MNRRLRDFCLIALAIALLPLSATNCQSALQASSATNSIVASITPSSLAPNTAVGQAPDQTLQTPASTIAQETSPPVVVVSPGENQVWLFDLAIIPEVINVTVGTTVTWTDYDTLPYTIMSDDGLFLSPELDWGMSWSFTFAESGSYSYHVSDDMNGLVGQVIVK
jgi:plastocyanin